MHMMTAFAGVLPAVLIIPLFAILNRLAGMDRDGAKTKGLKAGLMVVAVAGGFLVAGVAGALLGLAWWIYRAIDFAAGSQNPRSGDDFAKAALHHAALALLALGAVLIANQITPMDLPRAAIAFAAYIVAAVVCAAIYGRRTTKAEADIAAGKITAEQGNEQLKQFYGVIEIGQGAAYGLAAWAALAPT